MLKLVLLVASFFLAGSMDAKILLAGTLESVKEKGVLVAGVKDATPPFGFRDTNSGRIIGAEVDLLEAIAKKLGVRLQLSPVLSSNRIPRLIDGEIDIIAATMSKTADRSRLVDFSDTYFRTGQMFLTKAGAVKSLKDLEGKRIATGRGSTSELVLRKAIPTANVVLFDDYIQAAFALKRGEVDAVTTDGAILFGILAMSEARNDYEIPDIKISEEEYALAVRKGDKPFLDYVNAALREMDASGEAKKIHDKWLAFLKDAAAPVPVPPPTGMAGGVVFRGTATPYRFLVMAIKGEFRAGGDVAVYDTEGAFICKGKVKRIYADEVYVDVEEEKAQYVEVGYGVGMNVSPEDAKKIILERQDILKSVRDAAKKESEQRQREVAAEDKTGKAERERWQEEMTKQIMQYNYQYDRYYYHGYGWDRW